MTQQYLATHMITPFGIKHCEELTEWWTFSKEIHTHLTTEKSWIQKTCLRCGNCICRRSLWTLKLPYNILCSLHWEIDIPHFKTALRSFKLYMHNGGIESMQTKAPSLKYKGSHFGFQITTNWAKGGSTQIHKQPHFYWPMPQTVLRPNMIKPSLPKAPI